MFRELAKRAGCPFDFFSSTAKPGNLLTDLETAGNLEVASIANWVASLQRPTGLFVCNDIRGQQVLTACKIAGVSVPDDIGVVGVDDDDLVCMLCHPTLSSVAPNTEEIGYQAAGMLMQMLSGEIPEHECVYVKPIEVKERQSTCVVAVDDASLAKVCRFIRQHVDERISVSELAGLVGLSRRQLERRFRIALECSPLEFIVQMRVDRMKQMLVETEMTLKQIAKQTGFSREDSACVTFKRKTGMSTGEYRSKFR